MATKELRWLILFCQALHILKKMVYLLIWKVGCKMHIKLLIRQEMHEKIGLFLKIWQT